jgi:hypothetical protein
MYMATGIRHAHCRLKTHVLESAEETSTIKTAGTQPAMYPIDSYGRITSMVALGVKDFPVFEEI